MKSIIKKIKDNRENVYRLLGLLRFLPDPIYLKLIYRLKMKKRLNLNNPQTFNEKIQWLKLHDRNPEYTAMVDKYDAKKYVADIIGEQYIVKNLGVWNNFNEIDFSQLPEKFVLKCTHNSGGVVLCTNKKNFDIKKAKKIINKSLKYNFYYAWREWPYKNVKPRIIAEEYLENNGQELVDYKLMMFNGKLECSFVCTARNSERGLHVTFYDKEWNILPFDRHYPRESKPIERPTKYEEMVRIAEKLSKGLPFVRVDLYEIEGKIYFGELTFYPGSGYEEFEPEEWDYKLGSKIILNK